MKVIFLDIDGVMNNLNYRVYTQDYLHIRDGGYRMLDPLSVRALNQILEKTDAKIVISSTWRKLYTIKEMRAILERQGVVGAQEKVVGETTKKGHVRGLQIQQWLDENEVDNFVIIDDDIKDMEHLLHKVVRTTFDDGLKENHIADVIEQLTGE